MQPTVATLDSAIQGALEERYKSAIRKLKEGDKAGAVKDALEGWRLMPAPVFGWDLSLSNARILARILRDASAYQQAIDVLNQQLKSEFHLEYQYHPHFLLGTVYFAMGEKDAARENFRIADEISRGRCFVDEDPAYKKLLRS